MSTPVITYQTLMDAAITKICAVCNNVSNFAGIPNEYKSGYSSTMSALSPDTRRKITVTLKTTISGNIVTEVNPNIVTTQLNDFFYNRGILEKATKNITDRGLANFYNNISAFCSARLWYYSSQMTATNIIVYNSGNVTYPNVSNIPESSSVYEDVEMLKTIVANQDVTLALEMLGQKLLEKIRCKSVRYTREISHTGPL